jgi:hypothetical protein
MSRKIYNRLSFMAVSWLDESTLHRIELCLTVRRVVLCVPDFGAKFLLRAFTRCTPDRIL